MELPIDINPPVKTYNHHAFGLGILLTDSESIKWIFNNYILLSYYPEGGLLTFDFYMDYIYCQPVFEREHIDDDMLSKCKIDIVKMIQIALDTGRYVIMCVNELFIPNTEAYHNYNFRHNIMVYGYDKKKKTFLIMGYDENSKSASWEVGFKDIKAAAPDQITFLRPHNSYDFSVNPTRIIDQTAMFYGKKELEPVGSYPSKGRYVGIAAIKKLFEDVAEIVHEGEPVDVRPFSLIKEHSELMSLRYNYLCSIKAIKTDLKLLDELNKASEALKNRVMLYNVRMSDNDAQKLIEAMAYFMEVEKQLDAVINISV